MKKVLALCLAVTMLLPLASCAGEEGGVEEMTTQAETILETEGETQNLDYVCELPSDLSFHDETVSIILSKGAGREDEFVSPELGNGVVADAVYERNVAVEEMLDVKLDYIPVNNVIAEVDQDIQSGSGDYEIVINVTFGACVPAIEGKYLNLSMLDNIDTSKLYWNQGYNDMSTFTDEGIQYLASGPLAISMFRLAFVTLYNKTLFEDYKKEDLYDVVMRGEWTLEYQYQLIKDVYVDKNGDGATNDDFYGFVTGDTVSVDPYLVTSDIHMIKRDADTGDLMYDPDTVPKLSDLCDKVQQLYHDMATRVYKGNDDIVASNAVINHFTSQNALMATTLFYKMETSFGDLAALTYGIAPLPKYDTLQEEYHSYVQAEVSSFGISAGVGDEADQEKCAATLEALAYYGYLMIRPAYYETVISERYMQDPESQEILDLIFRTLDFDFASCWSDILGVYNIRNALRPVLSGNNNTVSSTTRGWKRSVQSMLDDYNIQIREHAYN